MQGKINFPAYSSLFADFYQFSQKSDFFFIVLGPHKSGKSVSIDLLSDKKINQKELGGSEGNAMVEVSNVEANYDNIYLQYF